MSGECLALNHIALTSVTSGSHPVHNILCNALKGSPHMTLALEIDIKTKISSTANVFVLIPW